MIRHSEEGLLRLTIATANDFAADRRWAAGYTCLVAGLHEALNALARGDPWAAELVVRYYEAVDTYIARYGIVLD